MRWVSCKWRRVFLPVKALDSAKAQSEMHEQIKECTHAHHLQSSFKQKSQQKIHFCSFIAPFHRMLSRIVYKSGKRQPLCDKTLSLCQNVWAFFTSSYTVQSPESSGCHWKHIYKAVNDQWDRQYTSHQEHVFIKQTVRSILFYWVCSLKLPLFCPV